MLPFDISTLPIDKFDRVMLENALVPVHVRLLEIVIVFVVTLEGVKFELCVAVPGNT